MIDLETAYRECQSITRREAKNFYYAFLTLPQPKRRAIYVAYAFCRHCDDAVDTRTTTEEKLEALFQIRKDLDRSFTDGSGASVFRALSDVARLYDIPQEYFLDIVSGVEMDLTKSRYQDFDELYQYCYRVASVVGLVCLQIFGYQDSRARRHAIDLGLAMQLTNIARDVKEDLEMGRIYLPQDELTRFGYSEDELQQGKMNQAFVDLMQFQALRAREYFRSGFQLLPYLTPGSRACPAVLGRLYSKILDRIEARNYDVLTHRVSLSTGEKVRVLLQTWLGSLLPTVRVIQGG